MTARQHRTTSTAVTTPIVADAYIRLSDLRDTDLTPAGVGKTFADREKSLRDFAAGLGWTIDRVVIENDVAKSKTGKQRGMSAFKRRRVPNGDGTFTLRVWRPAFHSILDDLRSCRVNAVIAEDLDRVMRDPRDAEDLIDAIAECRGQARSLSGSLTLTDGGTDGEITMARMLVTMGNKSSRDTSRRVAMARERKAHNNEWAGGTRPYGFELDGVTKRWDECAVIATATLRRVQGVSLKQLVRDLKDAGVPTSSGEGQWDTRTLKAILIRARNAGVQVYRGEEIGSAAWRPIVPVDLYRQCCRKLAEDAVTNNPGNTPRWLGSCLYRCGLCTTGYMVVTKSCGRRPTYRCQGGHLGRLVEPVDTLVVGTVIELLSRPEAVGLFRRPTTGTPIDPAALRAESATITATMEEMAEDRAAGHITRHQLIKASAASQKRLAEIDKLLASAVVESPLMPLVTATDIRAAWKAQPLSIRRIAIDTLVDVTILPSARGARFDPSRVRITPKVLAEVAVAA